MRTDIVVIGGGLGGCAAALSAARLGRNVILTEETDWIGGQLTSQAVPPDEHPWIEKFGCTQTYRSFRNGVRAYYRRNYPLTAASRETEHFNPGNARVSRLSHEPRVALSVLKEMLAPYVGSGRVRVLTGYKPVKVDCDGDRLRAITLASVSPANDRPVEFTIQARFFLDATETGELLPLAGVEYVTGAESAEETGEPHAPTGPAQPLNMQAITHCFAVDYQPGQDCTIEKPAQYDFWKEYKPPFWPDRLFSWVTSHPQTREPFYHDLFPPSILDDGMDRHVLWLYRRLVDAANFAERAYLSDIVLINWPQNDYWLGPVFEVDPKEAAMHLESARQLSLSLLYWLQTEAPRPDGGQGWPGLRLRPDVVGETPDGLAKMPYIRESRRIRAEFTVVEQHVGTEARNGRPAERFIDSVGVGCYRIDLHPSTGGDDYIDISALPFQIPLGALLPVRIDNLLPACKNIGTTHITNGAYRLHPVEWNIGEAAGALAAFCLERRKLPRQVRESGQLLRDFQNTLTGLGVELEWPQVHAV